MDPRRASTADRRPNCALWASKGRWVGSPTSSKPVDRERLDWLWDLAPEDLLDGWPGA